MFCKRFPSKNQLPGLSVNGTLVENGLRKVGFNDSKHDFIKFESKVHLINSDLGIVKTLFPKGLARVFEHKNLTKM